MRRVRASGGRQAGGAAAREAHGPQPGDRCACRDPGQVGGQGAHREATQGRGRRVTRRAPRAFITKWRASALERNARRRSSTCWTSSRRRPRRTRRANAASSGTRARTQTTTAGPTSCGRRPKTIGARVPLLLPLRGGLDPLDDCPHGVRCRARPRTSSLPLSALQVQRPQGLPGSGVQVEMSGRGFPAAHRRRRDLDQIRELGDRAAALRAQVGDHLARGHESGRLVGRVA